MFGRRKVAALVAEFLSAGVLTLAVLSVQRSTIGVPYFVAIGAGLTVAFITFAFANVSGGHANPAITLAMWTARKISTVSAILYIIVQMLGAWAAYGLYTYFVNSGLQKIGGNYSGRVLVAEAVGAFIFALTWGVVYFRSNFSVAAKSAILGLGFTLAIIIAAGTGIGIVNPAVAFGIRAWELWGAMGWGTYLLGPVLGAVIGVNLYGLLFAPASADEEAVVVEEVVVAAAPAATARTTKKTAAKATTKKSTAKKPAAKKRAAKK